MRCLHFSIVVAALWMVAGCSVIPEQDAVDRAWFMLELPEEPAARSAGRVPLAVELGSVRVAPAYAGKGLVYRLADYRYESDFYNEWFLAPREHFEQLLRERWTRAGAAVELVEDARAARLRGRSAVQLHVLVTALYGDLDAANPDALAQAASGTPVQGVGRVAVRAQVQGDDWARLARVEADSPIYRRSAARLVAALSQATAEVFTELEDELLREARRVANP
ncbi:MAG: membrane integrity-associated transporter subunit PqiC [Thioalkalivibrio sp.]|nr:membrane integrity-associated transporter subunit PqiC [Thioalkalivibrio sp.]